MRIKHLRWVRVSMAGIGLVTLLITQSGCSVLMAARQPPKKDMGILKEGMPRSLVISEFGYPISSNAKDGKKVDVYSFTEGYSTTAKICRVVFHAAADVFTIFLWEIIGTPSELAFDGKKMACEVTYDGNDKVEKVVMLQK